MLTKSAAAKNAACDAVVDLIDIGTGLSYGTLNVYTSDSTLISSSRLSNPAFADATDGTSTANLIYDATAFVDGTAATFGFYDRDSTWVWGGDISLPSGGGVMELSSLSIPADTTVSINSSSTKYIVP